MTKRNFLATENWIILAIGVTDLIVTIVLIKFGIAFESNPLFAFIWHKGVAFFICAKLLLLLGPICIFEVARKKHPRFTKIGMRFTICAYLGLYILGMIGINVLPFLG
jgi:hypothetical protein